MSFNRSTMLVNTRTFNVVRASLTKKKKSPRNRRCSEVVWVSPMLRHLTECNFVIEQRFDTETMRLHETALLLTVYVERADDTISHTFDLVLGRSVRLLEQVFDKGDPMEMLDALTRREFLDAVDGAAGSCDHARDAWEAYNSAACAWRVENRDLCNRLAHLRAVNGETFIGDDCVDEIIAMAESEFARANDLPTEPRAEND